MKIKSVTVDPKRVKAGPQDDLKEGEFIVYPATFTREPDSYGDVIAKGAFADSIEEWKASGDVMPGMYLHDPTKIVASATDMGEDDHGWWVKGEFDDDPDSQRVYKWLKGRRVSALSFAFGTEDEGEVKLDDGRKANELRKVRAFEFSFLPKGFAANSDTSVVAVKSATDALLSKAGRVISKKNEAALREARDSIDSVLSALGGDEDGEDDQEKQASGEAEAKSGASDEEPSGAKSSVPVEEPKSTSSVARLAAQAHIYALNSAEGKV